MSDTIQSTDAKPEEKVNNDAKPMSPPKDLNKRSKSRSRSRSKSRSRSRSRSRSGSRSRSRSPDYNKRRGSRSRSRSRSPPKTSPSKVLGLFGLSSTTRDEDLREEFARFGELERVNLIIDKRTGRSRCFGFIYFVNQDDAIKAKETCNGMRLHGRTIRIDYSVTQRAHSPTPGRYMGKVSYKPSRRMDRDSRYPESRDSRESRYSPRRRSPPRGRDRYDPYEDRDRYYRGGRDRYDDRDRYREGYREGYRGDYY